MDSVGGGGGSHWREEVENRQGRPLPPDEGAPSESAGDAAKVGIGGKNADDNRKK